jgi:hypothetical protein
MARTLPPHCRLNDKSPDDWSWEENGRELIVVLTAADNLSSGGQMIFQFVVIPKNYKDYNADEPNDLRFGIQHDCRVTFVLDSKIRWRWSNQYFVISSKKDYKACYGNIQKIDTKKFQIDVKYNEDCNYISDAVQKFNLNVDFWQGQDSQYNDLWVPLTIDPDVPNPKPGNFQAVSGPICMVIAGSTSAD